jgi:hypothetical protein
MYDTMNVVKNNKGDRETFMRYEKEKLVKLKKVISDMITTENKLDRMTENESNTDNLTIRAADKLRLNKTYELNYQDRNAIIAQGFIRSLGIMDVSCADLHDGWAERKK